jgi:hypothetical protein
MRNVEEKINFPNVLVTLQSTIEREKEESKNAKQ